MSRAASNLPETRVLRARAFRSVAVEAGEDGTPVVVKRFHHPNPLKAVRDRRRARHEHAALEALAAAGLRVPRSLGVRQGAEGWELRMQAVAGARGLDELFEAAGTPPGGWERQLRALGRLLADLHGACWSHGDLHPGNVLVDGAGAPWLVDVQSARRGGRRAPARELSDVVRAAAVGREHLAPRTRARFLVAWARAAGRTGTLGELAREVEERARTERRAMVRAGLGRWLRDSSRVRLARAGGRRVVARRDLPPEPPHADGGLLVLTGPDSLLREAWLEAAALVEHRVPAARPAWLVRESRRGAGDGRALFEAPVAGAPTAEALHALLRDRGLDPERPAQAGPHGHHCIPRAAARGC